MSKNADLSSRCLNSVLLLNIWLKNVTPIEMNRRLKVVYRDQLVDVRCWVNCKVKKWEKGDLADKPRSGRPVTATDEFHRKTTGWSTQILGASKKKSPAFILDISKERVGHIINMLGCCKVCARWVPRMSEKNEGGPSPNFTMTFGKNWNWWWGLKVFSFGENCDWGWNVGPLLWPREQKAVDGIPS